MKKSILLFFLITLVIKGYSQEQQIFIGEVVLNFKHDYVARIRPVVYTIKPGTTNTYRADIMFGKKFFNKHFTLLAYWKNDTKNIHRLGFRSELTWKFLDDKLNTSMQYRYFWPLNEKTTKQQIIIPALDYKLHERLRLGTWLFNAQSIGSKFESYLGPTAYVNFTKNLTWFVSYNWDLLSSKHLLYTILQFSMNLEKKN